MRTSAAEKLRPLWLAALAMIVLPFALSALGLSLNTGIQVVALAIATMGLNLCIGYTGLVSFGHSTWFGIGAYAAGLIQLHLFPGEIWLPIVLSRLNGPIVPRFRPPRPSSPPVTSLQRNAVV